jgi:hypothetical protein
MAVIVYVFRYAVDMWLCTCVVFHVGFALF